MSRRTIASLEPGDERRLRESIERERLLEAERIGELELDHGTTGYGRLGAAWSQQSRDRETRRKP